MPRWEESRAKEMRMGNPEMLQPEGLPAPLGQYSHVTRSRPEQLIIVAGQVAVDERGELVGEGDFDAQMRQVFNNLEQALNGAGSGLDSVMKFTTYLTRAEDLEAFRRVRQDLFAELYPEGRYPANTLLVVTRLVSPAFLVEIEAIATV
jgi:enamine deaminase RidA (YjgF/YER057c/UK114 family)